MYNYSSSPTLTNVTFSGNTATYGGGLYNNDSSSPTLTNVTFSGNTATNGGGMYNYSSSNPTVRNSILWGDSGGEIDNSSSTPTVSNSVVQGGYGGGTNIITTDPLLGAPGSYGGSTNYTASASAAYTQVVNSACTPVSGPDFTFAPAAPRVGEGVTFTGTLSAGTAPITYTWDWGDTTAGGSGAIVLHTFPLTVATQTYTVTLTAGNTCGPAALVQHPVTVQPRRVYLPLILR